MSEKIIESVAKDIEMIDISDGHHLSEEETECELNTIEVNQSDISVETITTTITAVNSKERSKKTNSKL